MALLKVIWSTLKANLQYSAAIGVSTVYVVTIFPHEWGIRKYMEVVQFYRNGQPVIVDETCQSLTQQVFDKMQLHPTAEASVQVFTSYGQDPINKGSTFTRHGGLLGLPINFTYKTPDDVEKRKMSIMDKAIDWESEAGVSFLDSLILSANAKRFAIAREISYLDTHHVHARGLLISGYLSTAYLIGYLFNMVTKLPKRAPLLIRVGVYSAFGGVSMVGYSFHNDVYNSSRDRKADKRAANLGRDYADGGVEFYRKTLQRNVALRSLLQSLGPHRYTAYGNDSQSWRSPNMPLTTRRDHLITILKSYTSNSEGDPLHKTEKCA